MSLLRKYAIELYGFVNKIVVRLGFKFDYIWAHRYIWIKNMDIQTVLDVGANKWQSVDRRKDLLGSQILFHCFEPLPIPFAVLQHRFNNAKNITLHNVGLWSDNSEHEIFVSNIDDSSSLLPPTETMTKTYEQIHFDKKDMIQIKTLDVLFSDLKIQWNILMKVDTQGYELEVFKWAANSLPHIAIIVVELSFTEFYENQPLFGDVHMYLQSQWFLYYGSFEQSADPVDGTPLQQDAIFVNKKFLN